MLKEQAVLRQANTKVLEHSYCARVRKVEQTIHASALDKFTFAWIDCLWKDLRDIAYELDRLPEPEFKASMEVIKHLREARDELRLARFLFDVEEIQPVHGLILRNRAVLRSGSLLQKVLQAWPSPETLATRETN